MEAYASCLDSRSQFYYTLAFLLLPLVFYLTEFLTLRPEYEPTGLRDRVARNWRELKSKELGSCGKYFCKVLELIFVLFVTTVALILWQPVTACCKFYRDAR